MEHFDTEKFIYEIKGRPSLWDSSLAEYSNRDVKKKCWREIVELFGGVGLTISERTQLGETLQKRWKNMRGCFTREINRKKTLKSGSGAGSRKSEYIYFNQLQFLQNAVTSRESQALPEPVDQSKDNGIIENRQEAKRAKKQKNEIPAIIKVITKSIKKRDQRDISEQDEDRLFLLSLLGTLQKVPQDQKMTVKIQIMTLLNEVTQKSTYVKYEQGYSPASTEVSVVTNSSDHTDNPLQLY